MREKRCWVCGDPLGVHLTFPIGPMCALNRTISEPPSHHECASWSARNCPFLSRPHMVRREDGAINEQIACQQTDGAATVAVEVWIRPWLSVAGTRCTRCTPDS